MISIIYQAAIKHKLNENKILINVYFAINSKYFVCI